MAIYEVQQLHSKQRTAVRGRNTETRFSVSSENHPALSFLLSLWKIFRAGSSMKKNADISERGGGKRHAVLDIWGSFCTHGFDIFSGVCFAIRKLDVCEISFGWAAKHMKVNERHDATKRPTATQKNKVRCGILVLLAESPTIVFLGRVRLA